MKQKKLYFKKETFQSLSLGGKISGFSFDMLVLFLQGAYHYSGRGSWLFLFENSEISQLINTNMSCFENNVLYYPSNQSINSVAGFNSKNTAERVSTLIELGKNKNNVCFSNIKTAKKRDINKKKVVDNIAIKKGDSLGHSHLISTLNRFGFKKVDFVHHHNEYSIRGDIVDVFPENQNKPVRVCFEYEVVEFLYYFDIETQRKTKTVSSLVIYDLFGQPVKSGRSLLTFIDWSCVFHIKQSGFGFFIYSEKTNETHSLDLSLATQKPLNIKNPKKIDKKNTVFVFYTNSKNKNKIKKQGFVALPGLINNPVKTNVENYYFFHHTS